MWGKILGGIFGFMIGGIIGAVVGVAIGHAFDVALARAVPRARVQTAFFNAVFSVLGHLSKVDGRVNEDEIRVAQSIMDQMGLPEPLRARARDLFREGKRADFMLDDTLDRFAEECRNSRPLMRIFLEILLQSAYADGALHPAEARTLRHVSDRLGFDRREFEQLDALAQAFSGRSAHREAPRPRGMDLQQAYRVLGCDPDAADAEIKRRYRRLLSQHHPDKLVARGLPEEMMRVASERTFEIRQAYEKLRAERGF